MKVLVLYSLAGYKTYKKSFDKLKQIVDESSNVKRIELDTNGTQKKKHNKSVRRKIFEADAVIIDNSEKSFRLGHEATIAIQKGKPTLVLSQHKDYGDYIDAPNFFGKKYAYSELEEIVTHFLKVAAKRVYSKRFNLFISEEQEEFLEKKAKETDQSKSDVLRYALDKLRS